MKNGRVCLAAAEAAGARGSLATESSRLPYRTAGQQTARTAL